MIKFNQNFCKQQSLHLEKNGTAFDIKISKVIRNLFGQITDPLTQTTDSRNHVQNDK